MKGYLEGKGVHLAKYHNVLFCSQGPQLWSWEAPLSLEVRCPCLGVAQVPETCCIHTRTVAVPLLPQLNVVFSKQIS